MLHCCVMLLPVRVMVSSKRSRQLRVLNYSKNLAEYSQRSLIYIVGGSRFVSSFFFDTTLTLILECPYYTLQTFGKLMARFEVTRSVVLSIMEIGEKFVFLSTSKFSTFYI